MKGFRRRSVQTALVETDTDTWRVAFAFISAKTLVSLTNEIVK